MREVAIVTGGSSGIGAAVSRLLSENGWAVAVNFRTRRDEADELIAEITQRGGRAIAVQGDVSVEADVKRIFETVDRELGQLTGLVNNAGIVGTRERFENNDRATIENVLSVNVLGTMLCSLEAVRRMSIARGGRGGSIVNLSSGLSKTGGALKPAGSGAEKPRSQVAYATSKGAINSFTMSLAQEVAGDGIRVNTVSPGATFTDMPDKLLMAEIEKSIPIGRGAQPHEIAEAIVWLMSGKASYVAGAYLRVGGGRIG